MLVVANIMRKHINILILVLTLFVGCKERSINCNEESFFIAIHYDGAGETKGDRLIIFNICDSLLKSDTIEMSFFKYAHHDIENSFLSFNLPNGCKITGIERVTNYYATIWSDTQQVYQYLKLNKINYSAKRDLPFFNKQTLKRQIFEDAPDANHDEIEEIETDYRVFLQTENVIYYPEVTTNDFIRNKFSSIKREDLSKNIKYELRDPNNIMEQANSKYEKDVWQSYVNKYKIGDFSNRNVVFDVNYFDVFIKLKINLNGENLERILKYDIHVGN
jgi:hypothetical protein